MLVGLIAVLVFASVALLVIGVARRAPSAMETRIQDFRTRTVTLEEERDLSVPFVDRVLLPSVEALARTGSSILPASLLANIEKQLLTAGSPMSLNGFVAMWVTCVVFFSGFMLMSVVTVLGTIGPKQALVVLVFGAIGWVLPIIWLNGRVKARQRRVLRSLPDALDLVTTCVEAGLGLDAALAKVAEKSSGPLADELSHMLRDVAMGKLRREALTEMSQRTGVDELINFINSVIQAEQLGVGIAQVLRVQAEHLRTRRRQRAETAAHEAPIKMIFPLVLFIFPAFLLVILGPAMIRISQSMLR